MTDTASQPLTFRAVASKRLGPFRADIRGATAIEYALIAALIALAVIPAMKATGGNNAGMWNRIGSNVAAATQ
jgi:pilus assembly protein Flp/PilA